MQRILGPSCHTFQHRRARGTFHVKHVTRDGHRARPRPRHSAIVAPSGTARASSPSKPRNHATRPRGKHSRVIWFSLPSGRLYERVGRGARTPRLRWSSWTYIYTHPASPVGSSRPGYTGTPMSLGRGRVRSRIYRSPGVGHADPEAGPGGCCCVPAVEPGPFSHHAGCSGPWRALCRSRGRVGLAASQERSINWYVGRA
jgi:hypothetical protein